MKKFVVLLFACQLLKLSAFADCWASKELIGSGAYSDEMYLVKRDKVALPTVVCFEGEGGTVLNNDMSFIRLGESTLVGIAVNGDGLESVSVYQVDRVENKILLIQSRIGTQSVAPLPDRAGVYIGDAFQID